MTRSLLTTRDTSRMQADAVEAMPSSAQIQRATTASDGAGGRTRSFATVATVACRITPDAMGAQEAISSDRLRDAEPYRVSFPAGTDVRITDRLIIGSLTLAVEAVRQPRSVELERVTFCTRPAV